ncbi:MAG: hypothetical protein ACI92I_000669 [Acidimicrobiales bacterium]|jgi:hypothetical protein
MNEEQVIYVVDQLNAGFDIDTIRGALQGAEYDESLIESLIAEAQNRVAPPPVVEPEPEPEPAPDPSPEVKDKKSPVLIIVGVVFMILLISGIAVWYYIGPQLLTALGLDSAENIQNLSEDNNVPIEEMNKAQDSKDAEAVDDSEVIPLESYSTTTSTSSVQENANTDGDIRGAPVAKPSQDLGVDETAGIDEPEEEEPPVSPLTKEEETVLYDSLKTLQNSAEQVLIATGSYGAVCTAMESQSYLSTQCNASTVAYAVTFEDPSGAGYACFDSTGFIGLQVSSSVSATSCDSNAIDITE